MTTSAGSRKARSRDTRILRAYQDLEIRRQILQKKQSITLPQCADDVRSFWTVFSRTFADAYGHPSNDMIFEQNQEVLAEYPAGTAGPCVLFSGGVESTYVTLLHPDVVRFTVENKPDVHPRGGEMFIQARARGFSKVLYGGNERMWGERDDGRMWDRAAGVWVSSEGFEFTEEFRELWLHYLGLRILCPTEHLYKDEIVQAIYDRSPDAYYALHSCDFRKRGWCGYCDKCLITGAIVDALGLPRLFRMRASSYSEEVVEGLKSYRTGDYDPFWKLQVFRRLEDVFGYNFKI